jgi:uroporphyrinogen decarboxylase
MNSKERVMTALRHEEPDRVPRGENAFDHRFFEQVIGRKTFCYGGWPEKEALWSGNREQVVADYIDAIVQLTRKLGWDYVRLPVAPKKLDYSGYRRISEHSYVDGQGQAYHFNPEAGNICYPANYNTDMGIEDLTDDPYFSVDDCEMDIARGIIERLGDTHFMIGRPSVGGTFPYIETIGMEEYLVRMITDPEFVHKLVSIENKKALVYIDAFMDLGCDGIMFTEDYADNRGVTPGVARYETFIRPYLKRLVDKTHARGGLFIKHSDGLMWDLLDSFVELGIDGWHGIQPGIGMDIRRIKEKYAGRLCLFGGINVETLIAGTPEEARREALYAMKYGAPGGGLILTSGNILEPGTRVENYEAVTSAWEEFGKYPIDIGDI